MGKLKQKRQLENAANVSISCAPAPPKKQKAVKPDATQPGPRTVAKMHFATQEPDANDAGDQVDSKTPSVKPIKLKIRPKLKPLATDPVPEPQDDTTTTPPTTKGKKANTAQQPAIAVRDAKKNGKQPAPPEELIVTVSIPKSNKDEAPALLSPPESRKSGQAKKPSEIAEKVKVQVTTKQNIKDMQAAKKARKAKVAVMVETPEETTAFLSRMKGDTQPASTSPAVTSPPQRKVVDRTKAMEQLVNAHFPSPNPSVISGASASTSTNTHTSSIAPSDSVSQTNVPNLKKVAAQSLQVPRSGLASRNVSPMAPPSL
ncbi:hypothetical protein FRC06_005666, partial [Ceratobasidium sp. 370]